MNNKEIKWEIKKVAPGMVKIEASPLGRMPTFEEFKQKAKEILSASKESNFDMLRDENRSQDLGDSLLLSQELKKLDKQSEVIHQIVFTYGNSTLTANKKTIDELAEKREERNMPNEYGTNNNMGEEVLENSKDFER
ncbi:MAG: hypothetical protein ACI4UX_01915 [Clostridia bacterium]